MGWWEPRPRPRPRRRGRRGRGRRLVRSSAVQSCRTQCQREQIRNRGEGAVADGRQRRGGVAAPRAALRRRARESRRVSHFEPTLRHDIPTRKLGKTDWVRSRENHRDEPADPADGRASRRVFLRRTVASPAPPPDCAVVRAGLDGPGAPSQPSSPSPRPLGAAPPVAEDVASHGGARRRGRCDSLETEEHGLAPSVSARFF